MSACMEEYRQEPMAHRFNPYSYHGGTTMAVSGDDFAIIASDTRLSEGFTIHCRNSPKIYKLTENTYLASSGFHADVLTLIKMIEARLQKITVYLLESDPSLHKSRNLLGTLQNCSKFYGNVVKIMIGQMYLHEHNEPMSTSAIAAMLSTILYYRRFFPYYVYNIIAGIDSEGKGCVYSYDPVGSYEREVFRAGGTAGAILQPLLDNQIGYKNQKSDVVNKTPLTVDKALALVKDVFISAAERDISTGDSLDIVVIKSGAQPQRQNFPLRRD